MPQRYFLLLSYRGERYHGWQNQPSDISVQQTIEGALSMLLRMPVAITGAGRTDAGVNARMMAAHFDVPQAFSDDRLHLLAKQITAICRPDIVIHDIVPVQADAHARFDAVSRTYRYFAHTEPSAFTYPLSWLAPPGIDFDAMNLAASHLLGRQDFTSFSKLHTDVRTNDCTVMQAAWRRFTDNPSRWYFEITADRFLRNMVRAIVGTLVLVGRHQIKPDDVRDIIDKKDRSKAGTSMPPYPLFLWDIKYPFTLPDTHFPPTQQCP